jgi:hypothetical protein
MFVVLVEVKDEVSSRVERSFEKVEIGSPNMRRLASIE